MFQVVGARICRLWWHQRHPIGCWYESLKSLVRGQTMLVFREMTSSAATPAEEGDSFLPLDLTPPLGLLRDHHPVLYRSLNLPWP